MRARNPSSPQRSKRASLVLLAVLWQGCADDVTAPPTTVLRPEVPAPTLATSVAGPLDGGSLEASVIEAGSLDARGPLLDASLSDEAGEAEGGLADAR